MDRCTLYVSAGKIVVLFGSKSLDNLGLFERDELRLKINEAMGRC